MEKAETRDKCHQIIAEAKAKKEAEENKKNEQAKSEGVNITPDIQEGRMYSKEDLQAMFNVSNATINNWLYSFLRPVKPTIMKHRCYYTSEDVEKIRELIKRHYECKSNRSAYTKKKERQNEPNLRDLATNDYTREFAENEIKNSKEALEARKRYAAAIEEEKKEWPDVLPDSLKEDDDE